MRMALAALGIMKTEKQVAKLLSTNKIRGTWHKRFPIVAEEFKLSHVSMRNAGIKELKRYQNKGFIIIVCYYYPPEKVDHYSVLKKIDSNYIHFYDPFFGPEHKYSISHFLKIWKSDPRYDNEKRWFFAVKK